MKLSRQKVYSIVFAVFAVGLIVLYLMQPVWNKAKAGGVGFSVLILVIAIVTFFRDDKKKDGNQDSI